ncbi:hypothetical protein JCGZ_11277 [Jatropha curcas]|uniref:Uncharacterized protein n=1 Tax=Jatropha curcas TaxID=180498 RepID=A0A067KEY1_JATCU|nr:hypothetical protein JCGZ_11277 [Jatropha curcas]
MGWCFHRPRLCDGGGAFIGHGGAFIGHDTTESSTQRVDFYHAQVRSGGCSSRPEDEHQSRYHILALISDIRWCSGTDCGIRRLVLRDWPVGVTGSMGGVRAFDFPRLGRARTCSVP